MAALVSHKRFCPERHWGYRLVLAVLFPCPDSVPDPFPVVKRHLRQLGRGGWLEPVKLQGPGELRSFSGRRDGGFCAIRRHQLLPVVVDERQTWAAMALGGRSLAPVLL